MLVESSQQTNIKLVDVAAWLVDEAQKPGRPGGPETLARYDEVGTTAPGRS